MNKQVVVCSLEAGLEVVWENIQGQVNVGRNLHAFVQIL